MTTKQVHRLSVNQRYQLHIDRDQDVVRHEDACAVFTLRELAGESWKEL
jgi:hypothetical protein